MGGKATKPEERQRAIDLRKSGMTYKEISDTLGNRSVTWVQHACAKNGLGGTGVWSGKRKEELRKYKGEGHSHREVAERFGISVKYAKAVCVGIAPQKGDNQYTSGKFDREANAKRYVDERTPWFEYAGGFTGVDGYIDLKCKKCGHIQHRSMVSVRHGSATCDNCKKIEQKQRQDEKQEQQRAREKQIAENKARREAEAIAKTRLVECEECGKVFETKRSNKVCCSEACSKKRFNRIASHRKDARIALDKRVDRDITVPKLFRRDNGVCWICGEPCDMNDYAEKDGTIICGNRYPSIDHVIPISDGGEDAWDNVRLAHRICNSYRYWKGFAPPAI